MENDKTKKMCFAHTGGSSARINTREVVIKVLLCVLFVFASNISIKFSADNPYDTDNISKISYSFATSAFAANITTATTVKYICPNGTECWITTTGSITGSFTTGAPAFSASNVTGKIYNQGNITNTPTGAGTGGMLASGGAVANNTANGVIILKSGSAATAINPTYGMKAQGNDSAVYNYGSIFSCGSYYYGMFVNGSGARGFTYGDIFTTGSNAHGAYAKY